MPCPAGKSWRAVAFVADQSARTPRAAAFFLQADNSGRSSRCAIGAGVRFIVNM
jgi:hypothetical protein